jgi:hypothetical protein
MLWSEIESAGVESIVIRLSIIGSYTRPHDSTEVGSEGPDGIRQRDNTYPVRISGGYDPVTGRQLFLAGSAGTEDAAIALRDRLRQQGKDNTAAKTNVTLGYLLDEWLAGHQVEETTRATYRLLIDGFIRPALGNTPISGLCRLAPRPFEQLYAQLRVCRRRCHWPRIRRAPDAPASRVRRAVREARVQAACLILSPPVPCHAQWRSERCKTMGLDQRVANFLSGRRNPVARIFQFLRWAMQRSRAERIPETVCLR